MKLLVLVLVFIFPKSYLLVASLLPNDLQSEVKRKMTKINNKKFLFSILIGLVEINYSYLCNSDLAVGSWILMKYCLNNKRSVHKLLHYWGIVAMFALIPDVRDPQFALFFLSNTFPIILYINKHLQQLRLAQLSQSCLCNMISFLFCSSSFIMQI